MIRTSRWVPPALVAIFLLVPRHVSAQWQANTGPRGAATGAVVGGDVERYLRALTLGGFVEPLPWGSRPYAPADLQRVLHRSASKAHPWRAAMNAALDPRASLGAVGFASANSGFPWGANDGALWQGRGFNAALGGSATLRWGPLSAVAAPLAFVAQNTSFPLMNQPAFGYSKFADPLFPTVIDLPQRMGDRAYSRFDGGESTLRLQAFGAVAGITTASLGWGSGESFPSLFGSNAGGFPHVFVGTRGGGIRVPILGLVSGRYVLGVLDQSAFSPVQGSDTYLNPQQSGTRRVGTGVNVSVMPSILPNLELGASRFYHSPYLAGGARWHAWSKPFEGLFKQGFAARAAGAPDPTGDVDNQMASFFARWLFPARGVEATVELFRDDHNWDSRDLALEPESNSAVMASVRAMTHRSPNRIAVLTLEYFDGDIRRLAQVREQGFLYTHAGLPQGHTQRGQLFGSPIGAGAIAGQRLGWERFTSTGSFRVNLQRFRTRALRRTLGEGLFFYANFFYPSSHDWILDANTSVSKNRRNGTVTFEAGTAWAGVWQLDGQRSNVYARTSWSIF
jgi:hypothetical protein